MLARMAATSHTAYPAEVYESFDAFMQQVIGERFMNAEHADMWSLVDTPDEVLPRIRATPRWHDHARQFAAVRG